MLIKIFRVKHWWNSIIPIHVSICFISIYINNFPLLTAIPKLLLFFISMIGTAAFGFFINDWADIESDRIIGKFNGASLIKKKFRYVIIILLLLIAVLPWVWLKADLIVLSLYVCQIIFLTIYSIPPFRFKRIPRLGFVLDAVYSSTLGFVIAYLLFSPEPPNALILLVIVIAGFIKGIRNIMFHQLNDYENDLKTGEETVAIRMGLKNSLIAVKTIEYIEDFILGFFSIVLSFYIPWFFIIYIVFLLFIIAGKLYPKDKTLSIYSLCDNNLFYEEFLPLGIIVLSSIREPHNLYYLIGFILLFRNRQIFLYLKSITIKFLYFLSHYVFHGFVLKFIIYRLIVKYFYYSFIINIIIKWGFYWFIVHVFYYMFILNIVIKWGYYWFIVHVLYHKIILFIYFKAFKNKYMVNLHRFFKYNKK